MTVRVFVDSNILIYSEDPSQPAKQDAANAWLRVLWKHRLGRISTQVINEFYVNVTRKITPRMAVGDARARVRQYMDWMPWQIDPQTIETAWGIEARYGLHYWDSLMIAAAQESECKFLLSEDMGHEQVYGDVQVLNPFLAGVDRLGLDDKT